MYMDIRKLLSLEVSFASTPSQKRKDLSKPKNGLTLREFRSILSRSFNVFIYFQQISE